MAEKVLSLELQRDYKRFLYFINGDGDVCRKAKSGEGPEEVLVSKAINRDNAYLYFVDKDGDVSRTHRVNGSKQYLAAIAKAEGGQ